MNLYQAAYTRIGKQGVGSGWTLVSESDGMSQKAKDGFGGFAGNLAQLINHMDMPDKALGVFRDDRFLYYLHINYKTDTETGDKRGISFIHGYCFSLTDYYTLCKNPEMLLGITENAFFMNYDTKIKAYPIVDKLPYQSMNFIQLKEKYSLSVEEYRRLLIGATCALEGYTDPLCIKINCEKEYYVRVCLEVMYLIMQGLPYHLRTKLTFFSYKGGKTNVYFSDNIEGNNYFDFDTKQYACDKSRLEKYKFTLLYNLNDKDINKRESIFKSIAEFMEQSFQVPLKEMTCEHVEHGFLAKLKNLISEDVLKDLVINVLTSFMGMSLKESNETDNYLTMLLNYINKYGLIVENEKLLNSVINYAQNSVSVPLQNSSLEFFARQILAMNKADSYNILRKQYQKDIELYYILIRIIKMVNETFYLTYYQNEFLPNRLKDLDSVISYLKECNGEIEAEDYFYKILCNITKRELDMTKTFMQQFEIHKKAEVIASSLKTYVYAHNYMEEVDCLIWSKFDIREFNPSQIELYQSCSLSKLAISKEKGRVYKVIQIVDGLVRALESIKNNRYQSNIYFLFFEDETLEDYEIQKNLLEVIKKNYLPKSNPASEKDFDLVVMSYYDLAEGRFDVVGLIEEIYEKNREDIFESQQLQMLIRSSHIFHDERLRDSFIEELQIIMGEDYQRDGKRIQKQILQSAKKFYFCLTGKRVFEKEREKAVFSIHKIAVGFLPLCAIGFFLLCFNQYMEWVLSPIVYLIGMITFIILMFGFKIYDSDGLKVYFNETGLTTKQWFCKGMGFLLGLGIFTIISGLLFWKLPIFQQEPYYLKTIAIVSVMLIYILIATIGAIYNSIEEEEF